jgi:hypothetical protein
MPIADVDLSPYATHDGERSAASQMCRSGAVAITVDLINGREEEVHEGRVCELFDVFAMCCSYVLVHTAVP